MPRYKSLVAYDISGKDLTHVEGNIYEGEAPDHIIGSLVEPIEEESKPKGSKKPVDETPEAETIESSETTEETPESDEDGGASEGEEESKPKSKKK